MDRQPRRTWLRLAPRPSEWRKVARRWAILLGAAALGALAVWFFLLRMPGTSHTGPLPELTQAQRELAEELRADVVKLANPEDD